MWSRMSKLTFAPSALILVLINCVLTFWLIGAWPQADRSVIEEARAAIQRTLRDPSSAQFFDEVVIGSEVAKKTVCGNLNAKNGFGGYTGRALFIYEQQTKSTTIANNSVDADEIMHACRIAKMGELKAKLAEMCGRNPGEPTCEKYR